MAYCASGKRARVRTSCTCTPPTSTMTLRSPQAVLKALCPSCHMKHDRRTERASSKRHNTAKSGAHRQGYQLISATHLVREAHGAGLHISPQGDRYRWQIGDLHGIANDVLDAIGSALHTLAMERLEEKEHEQEEMKGGVRMIADEQTSTCSHSGRSAYS